MGKSVIKWSDFQVLWRRRKRDVTHVARQTKSAMPGCGMAQ